MTPAEDNSNQAKSAGERTSSGDAATSPPLVLTEEERSARLRDVELLLDLLPGLSDTNCARTRPRGSCSCTTEVIHRQNGDCLVVVDRAGGPHVSVYNYYYQYAYPSYYTDYPYQPYYSNDPNPYSYGGGDSARGPRYVIVLIRRNGSVELYTRDIHPDPSGMVE